MNVLRTIVEQNINSALVLESDVDWDIRIKQQMQDFALASRLLIQPLAGTTDQFIDPTYPAPASSDQRPVDIDVNKFISAGTTSAPTTSPYGDIDRWDLLWVGHCGTRFPKADDQNAPLGRAIIRNDASVPEQQHLDVEDGGWDLLTKYPAHTRIVHRARVSTCTLGYGVSQQGARLLLHELALREMTGTADMMFRSVCDGVDGRPLLTCLTVQPQLFSHHRRVGDASAFSDINVHDGYNERAYTKNVRWSTRLNFDQLLNGRTDYIDLFKDGEPENHFEDAPKKDSS
ncbi:putative mfs transporter protein [Neofusicoccum parvum]|uniref:Mfs transporter protein n=1 Tax=Neofusicoccum parvum TaxID=310453 RepID=A0ACB5RTX4_9PEZI|nr:putative mfs transporter protein [Neofusicoccum parvum]GME55919.1 putative mfs transporter protein [Neofusicoccum parvum]